MRAADGAGLETVVVRPRFVWGRGDTTLLPALTEMVRSGRFRWVGGGRQLTAITHIDNTVEGLWLGATCAVRRRLLRNRRCAGGVPRLPDPVARHAGSRDPRQVRTASGRERGGRDGRARVAAAPAQGQPAAHALRGLGLVPGVHDRHLARRARARLPAGHVPRGRSRRAQPDLAPAAVSARSPTRLRKNRLKRPIEISSPSSSSASSTRAPLRNTPFRLRSSRTRAPESSR